MAIETGNPELAHAIRSAIELDGPLNQRLAVIAEAVRMADLLATGPLVVTFQRGHWCPYCRLATLGIAEIQEEVIAAGGKIVAIVPEQAKYSKMLRDFAHARFPVLSDINNGYALSINLAIWVGEDMERVMAAGGVDLPRYQGGPAWFLPIPATFVLDGEGIIRARYVDPDHRRRMEIDDLLAAVRQAR